MPKKSKLKTPEWILEGYDSEEDYLKKTGNEKKKEGKTFKIRECPKCRSDDVCVVVKGEFDKNENSDESNSDAVMWECRKCKWRGTDIVKKELTEDEMMKYLDEKGEEVA